jgi:uncharacterized protein (TIGR00269 family)
MVGPEGAAAGGGQRNCECGRRPVTYIRYSGRHQCGSCLTASVEERARGQVRRQADLVPGTKVAVAVSGGKDSLVALTVLAQMASARRGVELLAITVDEGIEGYRAPSVEAAAGACASLGVEHRVVSLARQDLVTVDAIATQQTQRAPCSYCGVLRRRLANSEARRWGAHFLATGHNLDDVAQSILMSFVRGDLGKMARMAPHDTAFDGLVPRILPLRTVPEKEVMLYALLKGLPVHGDQCPHMGRAARGPVKEMLLALEDAHPGTRHTILATHERIQPLLRAGLTPDSAPGLCPRCGEPSAGGVCQACTLLDEVRAGAVGL